MVLIYHTGKHTVMGTDKPLYLAVILDQVVPLYMAIVSGLFIQYLSLI